MKDKKVQTVKVYVFYYKYLVTVLYSYFINLTSILCFALLEQQEN